MLTSLRHCRFRKWPLRILVNSTTPPSSNIPPSYLDIGRSSNVHTQGGGGVAEALPPAGGNPVGHPLAKNCIALFNLNTWVCMARDTHGTICTVQTKRTPESQHFGPHLRDSDSELVIKCERNPSFSPPPPPSSPSIGNHHINCHISRFSMFSASRQF